MAHGEPPVRSLSETLALLRAPFALEDLAQAEPPLLVASVPSSGGLGDDDMAELSHLLASVRAVTVAVLDDPPDMRSARAADAFDIVVAPPDIADASAAVGIAPGGPTLGDLADVVGEHPASAVAMVELLRQRAYEAVPQGLVLESLTYSTLQSGPAFAAWLADRGPAAVPPDPEPPVLVDRGPTSLRITLNRPHRANAFSAGLRDALVEALRVASADPSIEGVVLDGAGASFSSGGDLAEFGSLPDPATGHSIRLQRSPAWWVNHLARDVRVRLHGHCVGAGIEVPAFAGAILATPDTRIRLPEVAMGLVPGAGGTVSIPRRIGRHRTAWLALTGVELDATTALSWGLVDRIVDSHDTAVRSAH